jgi:hypothetical protein
VPRNPDELRRVPLFDLLDDDEAEFLAAEAEIKRFEPRQLIFQADNSRPFSATRSNGAAGVFPQLLLPISGACEDFSFGSDRSECTGTPVIRPWKFVRRLPRITTPLDVISYSRISLA